VAKFSVGKERKEKKKKNLPSVQMGGGGGNKKSKTCGKKFKRNEKTLYSTSPTGTPIKECKLGKVNSPKQEKKRGGRETNRGKSIDNG